MSSQLSESLKDTIKGFARAAYERGRIDGPSSSSSSTPEKKKGTGLLARIKARHAEKKAAKAPKVSQGTKGATIDFTKKKPSTTTSVGSRASVAFKAVKSATKKSAPKAVVARKKAEPTTAAPKAKKPAAKTKVTPRRGKKAQADMADFLLNARKGGVNESVGDSAKDPAKKTLQDMRKRRNASYSVQKLGVRAESVTIDCTNLTESAVVEDFKFKELNNTKGKYSHQLTVHASHKNKKDHVRMDLIRHHSDPEGHWRLSDVSKADAKGAQVKRAYDREHANTLGPKHIRNIGKHLNTTYGIKTVRAVRVTGASAQGKDAAELKPKTFRLEHYTGFQNILSELRKDTIKKYVLRATDSRNDARNDKRYVDAAQRAHAKSHDSIKGMYSDWSDNLKKKIDKRTKGLTNAADKL